MPGPTAASDYHESMGNTWPLEHAKITTPDGETIYLMSEAERKRMQPALDQINALGPQRTVEQVAEILNPGDDLSPPASGQVG